jgi:arylsulfatase A-like enzyme
MTRYNKITENNMCENVLLITIDSLRYDSTPQTEGDERSSLDDSQSNTTSFTRAFATGPGTTPSFPAMITGTLPLSYGGLGPLTDERPRVAANLQSHGITTAAFQCNPFLSEHFNYEVGYDQFKDYQNPLMGIATKIFPRGIEINNPKLARIDDTLHITDLIKKSYQAIKGKPRPYVSAEVITDDTIEWLQTANQPFFCWTHYMDVHHPCFPPQEYRQEYDVGDVTQTDVSDWYSALLRDPESLSNYETINLRKLYNASIAYVDDQIQRIVDLLKTQGLYENTTIIITSDHGELFGDHEQYGKPERMFDELLHVPLIITNGPDYLEDAQDQLVSLLDIPPVIHDIFKIDIPTEYEGQLPGVDEPRSVIMAEHEVQGEVIVGARSLEWLYEGDEIVDEHRLFDLRDGFAPAEINDPDGKLVRKTVLSRLNELDVDARYLQGNMEEDVESRLEDLGYL